ncbi:MAG: choline dehydrogenase [Thiolinea sp.]
MQTFDYIIIGTGSAGSVVTNRLSEDSDVSVLVLEAGGNDWRADFRIHMPAALAYPLANDTYNWYFMSEPEPHMNNRRMYCPRGRVLGGSSSINGMEYIRGHALDYNRWAEETSADHWNYAHCLPYFMKAENHLGGADDYHGSGGYLTVTPPQSKNPLYQAWIEAGQQAGYPFTADVNGYQQEGFGPYEMSVRNSRRGTVARSYLAAARLRPNVSLEKHALVTRILFEGQRAVGVEYLQKGQTVQVRAEHEVIVSGGAISSPQILLLSGVGPADELRAQGIDVVLDKPGVGQNLTDHLEIYLQTACKQPITLYSALKPWNQALIGAEWLFLKRGIGASNQFEAGGFIRTQAGIQHPNLQYHFLPIAMNYDGSKQVNEHGYQAHVGPMRPTSRGHIRLKSADPTQHPHILFNYMSTEHDRAEIRDAVRLTREILAQPAFAPYRRVELAPGPEVQSDAEIDAFVRSHGESAYHPCSTCRMGKADDPLAVVDAAGRVYGLEGLRVIDASIMPSIASGNLNAPTIMLAEKLADAIRGQALPPSPADFWVHPHWETQQR